MRIFALSDIHGSAGSISKLAQKAGKADLVVCCGDFYETGAVKAVEMAVEKLGAKEFFAVPGNEDGMEVQEYLEQSGAGIHKKKKKFSGYSFVGIGGGKPVHTFYKCNMGELEAKRLLEELLGGENPEKTVIVSHCPPAGRLGLAKNGSQLGLKALREKIEEFQPLLVLCGHVHESSGTEMIGKTLAANIGAILHSQAATVEIAGEKLEINLLKV